MSHARTIWEEGREPGRQVVALGVALALTAAAVELALAERISWGFDILFVLLCLALALLVTPRDFFTVGVLPPLLMLLVFTVVAVARRGALGRPDDSLVQAVIAGLAGHSLALCLGYGLCLGCLAVRRSYVS
ncbi:MAG TPA: DUF6542 domain-containing protein [Nocardioides sp.]|uniref:DUF6542 domain-containing protein n=1 Tax=Nocardioides sp. TaxID=35761 RepID=UPI002ED84B0F